MSAAESLSVGSVASIASQEGGLSQTSAALSIYGPFVAPAALSTTQHSAVSNAIETALSGTHDDDGHDHTSQTATRTQFGDEGGVRHRLRSNRRRELELGTAVGNPDAPRQMSAGAGVQGIDSTMAVVLSSVGNDGGSSVAQILHGESAAEEHSVNKAKVCRTTGTCRMSTRLMERRILSAGLTVCGPGPPNTQAQPDAPCEPNGSMCSLARSNSIHTRNSANEIDDEVESNTAGDASAAMQLHAMHNFTDIPMLPESDGSTLNGPQRGNTWPLSEGEGRSLHDTVNKEGSGGYLIHEVGQNSIGVQPSESIQAEGSIEVVQGSLVESNEAVESSPTAQASHSVQQSMNAMTDRNYNLDNDDRFRVKRKDPSFNGGSSGKRRH